MSVIIGCDPGMDGAIAILVDGELLEVHDMPTITNERRSNGMLRKIRTLDVDALAVMMRAARYSCPPHETPTVVIEHVNARPGEAAQTAFNFGGCFLALCTVPASLGWVWTTVTPQVWKPSVGLPVGADKVDSLELARALFPEMAAEFRRNMDHGRAEAALLAHWRYGR